MERVDGRPIVRPASDLIGARVCLRHRPSTGWGRIEAYRRGKYKIALETGPRVWSERAGFVVSGNQIPLAI